MCVVSQCQDEPCESRKVGRLSAGSIQVVKHSYAASDFNLACDLLIVDEAHRAKGEGTAFSRRLKQQIEERAPCPDPDGNAVQHPS